jgi:ribosomal protein S3
MLRKTLTNLFPELLNPVLKKIQKREDDVTITPRITQIKIERGLIPYEIGIQIHAENCELLKSAIDNLKVNRELVAKLQKARCYLLSLKLKLKDIATINKKSVSQNSSSDNQNNGENKTEGKKGFRFGKTAGGKRKRNFLALSKQEQRRQRIIKKRLRKRQSIRRRYRQLIAKGLFIKKKGTKVIQKLTLKNSSKSRNLQGRTKLNKNGSKIATNAFSSRIKKKFVTIFINKMNKKFFKTLKENISYWNDQMQSNKSFAPLGYNKKWSLNRLSSLKSHSLSKLNRLISVLEQKSLIKLESLRKEFIAFGSISKIQSFGYYQVVNFLKNLKELVNKLKREQKLQFAINKVNRDGKRNVNETSTKRQSSLINSLKFKQSLNFINKNSKVSSLAETVLHKKLNNIDDECRKIKFIEYLKDIVKKHRTENIYFYLSTIADARKDLRKIKQFTKRHANFLFGLNLNSLIEAKQNSDIENKVTERVSKMLEKTSRKSDLEKTLQDIFLEQIEKQRNMFKENAQLTPKISIKFYSVNSKTLKSKASVVSDSVVDALEKRKAFRKVIKDAKDKLMKTAGVKGVKIQVAGRLNGAEIARTEWVRAGRVPLQTLRANLDYSYRTASTIYGIIGVKVWIFKGYTTLVTK